MLTVEKQVKLNIPKKQHMNFFRSGGKGNSLGAELPKMAFRIEIHCAFPTVRGTFVQKALKDLNFPARQPECEAQLWRCPACPGQIP